jgi:cytochrome c oxidase assembly protein Cox11
MFTWDRHDASGTSQGEHAAVGKTANRVFLFYQSDLRGRPRAGDMPQRFVIDPRLSEDINTVSLAYTFFDITQTALKQTKSTTQIINTLGD